MSKLQDWDQEYYEMEAFRKKNIELIDTFKEVLEILGADENESAQDAARRVVKERDDAYEKAARQCYVTNDNKFEVNSAYFQSRFNLAELFQMRIRALKDPLSK